MLKKKCDQNIQKTLDLAEKMILLAHQGDEEREDSSCGVLYGTLLDAGYKLKRLASREKQAHISKGWWKKPVKEETNTNNTVKEL
ncbi:hypothetical protein SAMN02746065_11735 [Desulfocicer vacuolatum DSM 3385]|uniref:Uncharacterized protein n=1 Tax=Desulfocicer vacuolatum DSM 3385 TaxID=1121400 RepID=A0A1W2DFP7_9BACT|nr:hypothetical protein [Desulfocicer vacuolatum]SMC95942.1 hypothetical protein SAMN02746065_11735 [Desulfocicer vacuolatum DSM 3385]